MRLTRRVPLKEQEQLSLPEHLSFSGVRVTRSLVSCVHFVDRFVCPFSFDHCVSSIYGFTSTYPSGAPEFTPGFSGVRVSLVSSNSS
jgi:hypothetical protein